MIGVRQDAHHHVQLHRVLEHQRGQPILKHTQPSIQRREDSPGQRAAVILDGQVIHVEVHGPLHELVPAATARRLVPLVDLSLGVRLHTKGQTILVFCTH